MSDTVIKVENLSKSYLVGHAAARTERHPTLRDAMVRGTHGFARKTRDILRGRPIIHGNQVEEFWALKDVSFEVTAGETLGIIGRNGAGKSTLLKILSRITEPTKGRITITGRVASLLEVGTGFHPELTGRENIYLNGAILGMTRQEIKRKFDEIVAFAEIETFLDTPVKRYSSGMYVRLAFAVAAHLEPEILIVDEVLAVGDAAFQKKCLGKMGDVASEGRTVLFVSHNMVALQGLCPRAILLNRGSIESSGPSQDVVREYLSSYERISAETELADRADRAGNGSIRAVGLMLGTEQDPQLGSWVCGENAVLALHYRSTRKEDLRSVEIALGIHRMDDSKHLVLSTKVLGQDIERLDSSGHSVCTVFRLPIEPGRYLINTEINQNGMLADQVKGAALVDVLPGDYYGTGRIWPYGGFLCDYAWRHEPSS